MVCLYILGRTYSLYLMFIGPCIIVIVEEWKTNLMSLAILFHFLYAQHVSDINIAIIRSLRLCCLITTSVVLFCKDGWFNISVNLRCIVVCVWCDVFCRFVVVGRCILIDIDHYLSCFVITYLDSWRMKDQLDVTCYFISLLMCSTWFGH